MFASFLLAPFKFIWFVFFILFATCFAFVINIASILSFLLISPFNNFLNSKINLWLAEILWGFFGSIGIEYWGRSKYYFYGDKIPMRENSIVTMNHRTFIDWAFSLPIAGRRGRVGCIKFFVKKNVKYIPAFGWGLYLIDTLFVSRNWTNDKKLIEETFKKLKNRKLPFWTFSFLEGTRLTPKKFLQSQEYCKKNNYPLLKHLLFPRIKGFVATLNELRYEFILFLYLLIL